MSNLDLRCKVVMLYKNFLVAAREYPGKPYEQVRNQVHQAFKKNTQLTERTKIQEAIARGEYVLREVETLIFLARYREMKRRYGAEEPDNIAKQWNTM